MSRYIRITMALLMVFLLCFGLCGCQQLDKLRAQCGDEQKDGSIIMKNGTVYRPFALPKDVGTFGKFDASIFIKSVDYDEGVPLLLYPETYGLFPDFACTENGKYMITIAQEEYKHMVYCREDEFSTLSALLADDASFTGGYCISQISLSPYGERTSPMTILEETETRAIQEILTGEATVTTEYQSFGLLYIQRTTPDHLFSKESGLALDFYYGMDGETYLLYDYINDDDVVYQYTVPQHLIPTISALIDRA